MWLKFGVAPLRGLHSDYFVAYWVVTGLLRVFYVRVRGVNPLAEAAPHTKRPFQVALG
jgi:hypothetical protein